MYRVLYRKWRPKKFTEVVGQPQVTRALSAQIRDNRLSHAYLFTGSRGTGKTSCAKIFAKAVNCLHPVDGNPCCECEICRGIDSGTILDIVEIDAASNRGIEDIRSLREEANFSPSQAKYRVYIIDEVHMLTIEAFNALLKTLEEPPAHVKFILATTEVQKLPSTILSRCQRYDFRRIEPETIAQRLCEIAEAEGSKLQEDAALLIARIADGGMRDALSLLDRTISSSSSPLTAHAVTEAAGLMSREYLFSICRSIADGDTAAALMTLDELHKASCDTERLCTELTNQFRNLLLIHTVSKPEKLIIATDEEMRQLHSLADCFTIQAILRAMHILSETTDAIRKTQNRRVEAEMALIRLCRPETEQSYEALAERVEQLENKLREITNGNFVLSAVPPVRLQETTASADTSESDTNIPLKNEEIPVSENLFPVIDEPEDDPTAYDPETLWMENQPDDADAPPEDPFDFGNEALPFDDDPDEPMQQPSVPEQTVSEPLQTQKPFIPSAVSVTSGIPVRTWEKFIYTIEKRCVPLVGHLANSTAHIQGSFIVIHSSNSVLEQLLRLPGFSGDVAAVAKQVFGKEYNFKVELIPKK